MTMLEEEKVLPHTLGYDKPTEKFLSFLRKHFSLSYFVPQVNNFVVFTNYFANDASYKCMKKDEVWTGQRAPSPRAPVEQAMPPPQAQQSYDAAPSQAMPSYIQAKQMASQQDFFKPQAPSDPFAEQPYMRRTGMEAVQEKQPQYSNAPIERKTVQFNDTNQIRHFEKDEPLQQMPSQHMPPQESQMMMPTHQEPAPMPEETMGQIDEFGRYIVPKREGFTFGAAGITPNQAQELEEARNSKRFNRKAPDALNKPEDGVNTLLTDKDGLAEIAKHAGEQKSKHQVQLAATDTKIKSTQSEIQKCQQRLADLKMQSETLQKQGTTTDKFLEFERQNKPVGNMDPPKRPDFAGSMYNKRNQYATVYDGGFYPSKNMSGRADSRGTLSNAGNEMVGQKAQNLNTYQHEEKIRKSPFGQFNASGALGQTTSSSMYGGFFKR